MKPYVHLVVDDKFIDFFCDLCEEVCPNQSLYLVISNNGALNHIQRSDVIRCNDVNELIWGSKWHLMSHCKVLIVHYLTEEAKILIKHVPRDVIVVWSGWGGDYYTMMNGFYDWAYDDLTKMLMLRHDDNLKANSISFINKKIREWRTFKENLKVATRIDYFSSPIPEDYELLRKLWRGFSAKYLQLNYGSVEKTFHIGPPFIKGENILVGNSADPANNHLKVFHKLKDVDLGERLVIVPLSYGDKFYLRKVLEEGERCLGAHFMPLTNFMPIDEYTNVISSCSTVIMNHIRQQALGNIGTMMYKGAKIAINAKSPAFTFFAKRQADFYDIETLFANHDWLNQALTDEQVNNNKKILDEFWGQQIVNENVKRLYSLANHDAKLQ